MSSTNALDQLIAEALAIEAEAAADAGALGFMARAMVQATLPHKKVEGNEFERRNGHYVLSIMAPSRVGLPYGTLPRLLLSWITTEAVRTKSRELELGDSLSGFMRELGLIPTGGRWGSIPRLKDQTRRLFESTISMTYSDPEMVGGSGFRVADRYGLWWDHHDPNQSTLWTSTIKLTETFFEEVTTSPVPVDMRAIKALKRSPLALDLYTWLTYRASYAHRSSLIPWQLLALQFGSDYARLRDFKAAFQAELRKVLTVYPAARVDAQGDGLLIQPSRPHIAKS